jgi:hypothetical protein
MIDGQSASLSWCKAASGVHNQIFVTVRQLLIDCSSKSKSKLHYDWWSAGQPVLVSKLHLGPLVLFPGCNSKSKSKFCYDQPVWFCSLTAIQSQSQSSVMISQSVLVSSPYLGPKTRLLLLSYSCGVNSLTGGWVCCLQLPCQHSHSHVQALQHSWSYFTVSHSRLPQPGGSGPHIKIPQKQGGSVIPPKHCVPFLSPSMARRATVKVFKHAFMRGTDCNC